MSRARPVYPGAVLFLTRRVHKRQLLLRPSEKLNQLFAYIVAVIAARHSIDLYALCVMSNHWHAALGDPLGRIVEFERDCHGFITRAVNNLHGESESLWAREQSCRVHCQEPQDTLDKIVYTMANPVEAGLVAHGKNWPGLRRAWPMKPVTIKRPDYFFRAVDDGGSWPDEVKLACQRPSGYEKLSDEELTATLREAVEAREAKARKQMRNEGRRFLGRKRVRAQSRYDFPTTTESRGGAKPKVAAASKWARVEALRRSEAWLDAYEAAKARFCAGDRSARFPFGTWKLRRYYRCLVDPPPTIAPFATA